MTGTGTSTRAWGRANPVLRAFHFLESYEWLVIVAGVAINVLCLIHEMWIHKFSNPMMNNDLMGAWIPAVDHFFNDVGNLYEINGCPFKNLPQLVFVIMPYYYMPGDFVTKVFAFNALVFTASLGVFFLTRRNLQLMGITRSRATMIAILSLMTIHYSPEYHYSQFNVLCALCLGISFFGMMRGNERIEFIFLGLSIMFKHITVFMVPVILFQGKVKIAVILKRLVYIAFPLIPSIFIFAIFPSLIPSFVEVNTTAITELNNGLEFASSLTKLVSLYTSLSPIIALVVVSAIGYGAALIISRARPLDGPDFYLLGSFVAMLVSPEFYGWHMTMFYPFILIWAAKYRARLAIAKVAMVLAVSVLSYFPLSSVILLFLYSIDKLKTSASGDPHPFGEKSSLQSATPPPDAPRPAAQVP